MTVPIKVDVQALRAAIQEEYAEVAAHPGVGGYFHTGRPLVRLLGYPTEVTDRLPDSVIELFAGVGNPFIFRPLQPGETVVEPGSGAGFDAVLAAQQVGKGGRVIGVDMMLAMLDEARANFQRPGQANVELRQGYMEDLPVADSTVDVVISNGLINLSPHNRPSSRRSLGCSGRTAESRWRTSSWHGQCRTRQRSSWSSGPVELPVLCWKQRCGRSSRRPV